MSDFRIRMVLICTFFICCGVPMRDMSVLPSFCAYRHFKRSFSTSHCLKHTHLTRAQCSDMAKMRCGVAPICLETGQYEGLTE